MCGLQVQRGSELVVTCNACRVTGSLTKATVVPRDSAIHDGLLHLVGSKAWKPWGRKAVGTAHSTAAKAAALLTLPVTTPWATAALSVAFEGHFHQAATAFAYVHV